MKGYDKLSPNGGCLPDGRVCMRRMVRRAILLGTAWALHSSWRLYRWTRGRELRCACGGMMSRIRYNRQRQKYRKCLACGSKSLEGAHCGSV